MKQFICRIWKYNSDSYCSLSRVREEETLEEFTRLKKLLEEQ